MVKTLSIMAEGQPPARVVPTFWQYNQEGSALSLDELKTAYKRDSTLDWKAAQTRKIANAYKSPAAFFNEKAQAIETAAAKAAQVYAEEFKKLTHQRMPGSLAHTRATKLANAMEELLRAQVEDDYPSDLSNLSLQLTYDNGDQRKSGFAHASTKLSSKPSRK